MSQRWSALYWDGLSPREEQLEVEWISETLILSSDLGTKATWPLAEIRWTMQAEGILYAHQASDATLLIPRVDEPAYALLPGVSSWELASAPKKQSYAIVLAIVSALFLGLVYTQLQPIAYSLADWISPAQEREFFGDMNFVPKEQICAEPRAQALIQELSKQLSSDYKEGTMIDVQLINWDHPNAFAFPGRHIYVTTGLLRTLETSEQLVAVLAHELGHLELRHNLGEFIRNVLSQGIWGLLVGDFSGAFVIDPQILKRAKDRAYAREAEGAADAFGAQRLHKLGFNPLALGTALRLITPRDEDLQAKPTLWQRLGSWFATHPDTEQRFQELATHFPQTPGRQALSPESWELLRSSCSLSPKN